MSLVPFTIPKFLNNGAEVLAFKKILWSHMIVCAKWNEEFVTWAVSDHGDAYWGHYFKTMDEAIADWKGR
jgi:hypothetical protein